MYALIIDTETDGLLTENNPTARCLEIGVILYDVIYQQTMNCLSWLITSEKLIGSEFSKIKTTNYPYDNTHCYMSLLSWLYTYKPIIVGHNLSYDLKVMTPLLTTIKGLKETWNSTIKLCTYHDFDFFPDNWDGKRDLVTMALVNNVPVWNNHRALVDCQLIASVFDNQSQLIDHFDIALEPDYISYASKDSLLPGFRWSYDYNAWYRKGFDGNHKYKMYEYNENELIEIAAKISYAEKERAKRRGFHWNSDAKQWRRTILESAIYDFPFPVERVN